MCQGKKVSLNSLVGRNCACLNNLRNHTQRYVSFLVRASASAREFVHVLMPLLSRRNVGHVAKSLRSLETKLLRHYGLVIFSRGRGVEEKIGGPQFLLIEYGVLERSKGGLRGLL